MLDQNAQTAVSSRPAQYLLRFDDICPTMNWTMWNRIESILSKHDVRPIVAVVPDNKDPALMVSPCLSEFWEKAAAWQANGWTLGLHGYQHLYATSDAGIIGIKRQSEFAGLPREFQTQKLSAAVRIFRSHAITPEIWVAPSHSFDLQTVDLLLELGLTAISDGLWHWPHTDARGMFWIPQQIWSFVERPYALWTIALHHNSWTEEQFVRFSRWTDSHRSQIVSVSWVREKYHARQLTLLDRAQALGHFSRFQRLRELGRWLLRKGCRPATLAPGPRSEHLS